MPAEQLQTLNRAISILDCFTQENTELGVREIARMVELSSSATGRLLAAMKDLGILSQNPDTRAYSMGARVLTWAGVYNAELDVRNRTLPAIQELHDSTRESISLYILDGNERLCIERLESPQTVRIITRVGRRLPLYAGSAGKVMLAFLSPRQQEDYFKSTALVPLTPKTIIDPLILREELAKIRVEGCAVSHGEWIEDAAGVAAPILDQNGDVVAALSISGPIGRFNNENVPRYCSEVKRVAAEISESLGYRAAASLGREVALSISSRSEKNDHSG
ncbi:MAG: IclR family transcriptional regulator [Chloroflexi bacterium]|nr:MAG: IclR family transcriptional regulator [Chloroflexota bacterium]